MREGWLLLQEETRRTKCINVLPPSSTLLLGVGIKYESGFYPE
jgi:hypothetical protein